MNRSTLPRLYDISQNIDLVLDLAHRRTLEHLRQDTAFRYAVLHALMIIAEAVRHLPDDVKSSHTAVPWKDIVGIGVLIKHEYHRVDPGIIWDTVRVQLPILRPIIKKLSETQIIS